MKDWTPATVNVCRGTSFHTNIANMHGSERIVRQKQKKHTVSSVWKICPSVSTVDSQIYSKDLTHVSFRCV